MKPTGRNVSRISWGIAALLCASMLATWLAHRPSSPRFLPADTSPFVALFPPPPAADSAQTRRELEELRALQRSRADAQVEAARADRRKDISQFYAALGLNTAQPPALPALRALMENVEDDVSRYVRAPKTHFARLRPYVLDSSLEPCIGGVDDGASYPSGHATYGFVMASLLTNMVPERRAQLQARAIEFAHQRAVCGVHFPSDIVAGQAGAEWLTRQFLANPAYRKAAIAAAAELRAALGLPPAAM